MKKTKRVTLYSNYYDADRFDDAKSFIFTEYGKTRGYSALDDVSDAEVFEELAYQEELDFDDFRNEFDRFCNKHNTLVLVGSCGRWNGRYSGGCVVNSFDDLRDFLKDCDYLEVYDDGGHLYITASHHDGTTCAELKELTRKGEDFLLYEEDDDEKILTAFDYNFFSRLPRFARTIYGA